MNKIETIKIRNFKGIDEIQTNVHNSNVFVVGGNGRGKTSFIDAVWSTLTGKNIPPIPIKTGTNESTIEIELTDYIAVLDFKKDKKDNMKQTFRLISKDSGESIASPRTVLNDVVGIIDFNPNHFFSLSAQKQIEYFCKLMNIDFGDKDRHFDELFDERALLNKELKSIPVETWFDSTIADKPFIDLKSVFENKIFQNKKLETFNRIKTGATERLTKIRDLQNQIDALNKEVEGADAWLSNPANQPMNEIELKLIDEQIANCENENETIRKQKDLKIANEKRKQTEIELSEVETHMKKIKDEKKKILSDSIDIDGLTFDGERFLFEGLPFENTQINTANQLIAGLKIGLKLTNDLRILRFDGSLIDSVNMTKIVQWSNENDIQLFVEQVDRTGSKLEIIVDEINDESKM